MVFLDAFEVIGSHAPVVTTAPPPCRAESRILHRRRSPFKVGGNVLEAKLVNRVMPVYPPLLARREFGYGTRWKESFRGTEESSIYR